MATANGKHQLAEPQQNALRERQLNLKGLWRIFKTFGRHYKKYAKILAIAGVFLLITIGVNALSPWPLKLILDYVILQLPLPEEFAFMNAWFAERPKLLLFILAFSMLVITCLDAIFSYFAKFWMSSTGDRINADIRERVFAHLGRLSLSFHDTARTGNLIYLLTSDVKQMKDILVDLPQELVSRVVTILVYSGLLLWLDWRVGLLALATLPVVYWFSKVYGVDLRGTVRQRRTREGEIASFISENVHAMAVVQAYGREDSVRERFQQENKASLGAALEGLRIRRTYSRLTDIIMLLGTCAILYLGGRLAMTREILPGTLLVVLAYVREIYDALNKFTRLYLNLITAQVSGERLLELVESDMVMADDPGAAPAPPLRGQIEFRNVTFAYKPGQEVLKNVNFAVAPGETVALVGHSGAGKTTLISLLMRFYDPQHGQILIDGQDIRSFTRQSLRAQLTILLQEAKLFRRSVLENLAFGRPEATDQEILEAARQAEAHEFIMGMPHDYDTMIYEGGDNLSGGQKQRLNIARALLRDTPILILDEPATGLDARAEAAVHQALRRLMTGRTTFIVAHKIATIAHADKILLLEEGQIAHAGTHEELLRTSARYREFYELQDHTRLRKAFARDFAEQEN